MAADPWGVVAEVLTQLIERKGQKQDVAKSSTFIDLGLSSLDFAEVVATLEMRLGQDPFQKGTPVSSIRTVDDLCRLYQ